MLEYFLTFVFGANECPPHLIVRQRFMFDHWYASGQAPPFTYIVISTCSL